MGEHRKQCESGTIIRSSSSTIASSSRIAHAKHAVAVLTITLGFYIFPALDIVV
jgi:hypothetical protein